MNFPAMQSLVFVNCQSSEAYEIIISVSTASLLGPKLTLIYANDRLKNIHRSLVNIYADYAAVFMCNFKNLNEHMNADIFSDLALLAQ